MGDGDQFRTTGGGMNIAHRSILAEGWLLRSLLFECIANFIENFRSVCKYK
jgi:hypothetical protein